MIVSDFFQKLSIVVKGDSNTMKEYNALFFALFENVYKGMCDIEDPGKAIEIFRESMEMGLNVRNLPLPKNNFTGKHIA